MKKKMIQIYNNKFKEILIIIFIINTIFQYIIIGEINKTLIIESTNVFIILIIMYQIINFIKKINFENKYAKELLSLNTTSYTIIMLILLFELQKLRKSNFNLEEINLTELSMIGIMIAVLLTMRFNLYIKEETETKEIKLLHENLVHLLNEINYFKKKHNINYYYNDYILFQSRIKLFIEIIKEHQKKNTNVNNILIKITTLNEIINQEINKNEEYINKNLIQIFMNHTMISLIKEARKIKEQRLNNIYI